MRSQRSRILSRGPRPSARAPHSHLGGALAALLLGSIAVFGLGAAGNISGASEPDAARLVRAEPIVRVRVIDSVREIVIGKTDEPGARVIVRPPDGTEAFTVETPITIRANKDFFVLERGETTLRYRPRALPDSANVGEGLEIAPISPRADVSGRVCVEGKPMPGDVRLHIVDSGTALDAIALIEMEEYVSGVIAKELYHRWPRDAFQAQAVAARSYALHERERARKIDRHYDVVSTTQDQVYAGATELDVAHQATRTTRGLVLSDRGELLRAYYSSTCGGRPASAADTFPTGAAYKFNKARPIQAQKRAHFCGDSPRYRWSVTRDADELTARVKQFARERSRPDLATISTIGSIRVLTENKADRPATYRIVDVKGKAVDIKAEDLRVACNTDTDALDTPSMDDRILSGDFIVIPSGTMPGQRLRFEGRGFGHGVGLCQFGCKSMASAGTSWMDILSAFYPGSRLVRAYD